MAKARSPWRALRPFVLAGAATVAWLTLSSTAAVADSSTESGSLVGGLTSSVSSLPAPLTGAVAPLQDAVSPATQPSGSAGLLEPLAGTVAGAADHLAATVPVVNQVVPADTVSALAVPVAAGADSATAALVETVAPPLAAALPVLEPVLRPVVELTGGTVPPLPVDVPVALPGALDGLPAGETAGSGGLSTVAEPALAPAAGEVVPAHDPGTASYNSFVPQGGLAATGSGPSMTSAAIRSAGPVSPLTRDRSTPPAPAPAG
ncbi:hypothetical protein, partial [Arthrobacter sp. HMWF013]|uniref:hypothetical protein n=1 Tax=Arthrobacter sp. HMWF013 TaxID=2056849 RepID=UPI000D3ACE86